MKCLKCNNEIDDNLKYCPQCGVKIDSDNKHKPIKILLFIIGILIFVILIIVLVLILRKSSDDKNYKEINYQYENSNWVDLDVDDTFYDSYGIYILLQNYNTYKEVADKYKLNFQINESDFNLYNYLIVFDRNDCSSEEEITSIKYNEKENKLKIDYKYYNICGLCMEHFEVYLYRLDKIEATNIMIDNYYHKGKSEKCDPDVAYKPILYLYPTEDINVNIKLRKDNNIISSYPKYNDGWNVYVKSDGNIIYDNREYYALYWDEYNDNSVDFSTGFYVDGDNAIEFLEEKLDIIGLNSREVNEFIMYWLPIFESNKHNLVYFELTEERENNNKLIINPKPDSLLRVNMHIKKVDSKVDIKEQKLESFNRTGFTVVEWGGTIHNN